MFTKDHYKCHSEPDKSNPQSHTPFQPFNICTTRSGYLNFTTWFMKNLLFEQETIKLLNKRHFGENNTDNMQHA